MILLATRLRPTGHNDAWVRQGPIAIPVAAITRMTPHEGSNGVQFLLHGRDDEVIAEPWEAVLSTLRGMDTQIMDVIAYTDPLPF